MGNYGKQQQSDNKKSLFQRPGGQVLFKTLREKPWDGWEDIDLATLTVGCLSFQGGWPNSVTGLDVKRVDVTVDALESRL